MPFSSPGLKQHHKHNGFSANWQLSFLIDPSLLLLVGRPWCRTVVCQWYCASCLVLCILACLSLCPFVVVVIAQQLFSYHQLSRLKKSATAAGLSHCKLHRMALTVEQMFYGVWCHSTLRTNIWYAAGDVGLVTVQKPTMRFASFCAVWRYFHVESLVVIDWLCPFPSCCSSFIVSTVRGMLTYMNSNREHWATFIEW